MVFTKKVVIVEDDVDLLETLSSLLEGEGHKVWKFERAKPTYRKLIELAPDTLVVDLMLPDGNGEELALYARKNKALQGTRVILISADERVTKSAKEVGADAYLKKPFSFDKLLGLV